MNPKLRAFFRGLWTLLEFFLITGTILWVLLWVFGAIQV